MGHASIKVTLDLYAKWWNLEDHVAADALGVLGWQRDGSDGRLWSLSAPGMPLHGFGTAANSAPSLSRAHSSVG
jgi:hypothetical protein